MGTTQSQPKADNSKIDRLKRYSRADKLAAAFAGKSSKNSVAGSVQQEEIRVTAEQRAVDDDTESRKGTSGHGQQGAVEEDHRVLYQTGHDLKVPASGCVHYPSYPQPTVQQPPIPSRNQYTMPTTVPCQVGHLHLYFLIFADFPASIARGRRWAVGPTPSSRRRSTSKPANIMLAKLSTRS
jgi:hypothetical protein